MYIFISSILSLAITAIISAPVMRMKNSSALFSAALGIIIFGCIKSIFAECGWGYAALFDIKAGMVIQAVMFAVSFLFFRELSDECDVKAHNKFLSRMLALFCFGTGKNLIRNYASFSDVAAYILGEAADFALTAAALYALSDEFGKKDAKVHAAGFAAVLVLRAITAAIYGTFGTDEGNFGALVLLTIGTAGLVCEFTRSIGDGRDISAAGFAAGLTVSFCFGALTE